MTGGEFAHLHIHTEYSLFDSSCRLEELLLKAKKLGINSLAITDIGSVNGAVRFYDLCRKYGIHPVIGCQMEVSGEESLVLLAANNYGYELLIRWINSGFDLKPCLNGEIIALSGGRDGAIRRLLKEGEYPAAEETARRYSKWFGKGNFYLEIQHYNLEDDEIIIERTAGLSKKTGIPLVATHETKYLGPDSAIDLSILKEEKLKGIEVPGRFCLASPQEMKEKFRDYPEALKNTMLIADRCKVDFNRFESKIPHFSDPEKEDSLLREICLNGLEECLNSGALDQHQKQNIIGQLDHELDIISKRKLSSYFLIVWDVVNFARERNIAIGPGRGSSAGSLAAFLSGITQVNPILHKLSFERFLSPDRPDMPDIDLDVCQRRRREIVEYIKERYGSENVVHLGVCNTFGTRGAIRKAAAFLDMDKRLTDTIAKILPAFSGTGGIRHCLDTLPELKRLPVSREPYKSLFYLAERVEGLPHNYSSHPSGILVGDEKLKSTIPVKRRPDGELLTTFDKEDIKRLGLLKLDLLGLRNLTIIEDTLKAVFELTGREIEVKKIPTDDHETFKTIKNGGTLGCFQLESMGIRCLMRKMKPENLEQLSLLLALYRPGAWQEGIVDSYLKRRSGEEKIEYICPEMEPVLSPTCGLIIYQEQVMEIANIVAGYSMGEADTLRRALAKKQTDTLAEERRRFISGAVKRGHTEKSASEVFDFLGRFAGYSFNKAHSISYAYVSYWTVYLKTHYPKEYMASLLSLEGGYYDKRVYIQEVKKRGIPLLGPDVNKSGMGFQAEKDGIRVGIYMIKGTGARTAESLLQCRQRYGGFLSLQDLIHKMKVHKVKSSVIESWINIGACDEFADSNRDGRSDKEKRKLEKELLGFTLNRFPEDKLINFLQRHKITPIESIADFPENARIRISGAIIHLRRQPASNGDYLLCLVLQDHSEMIEVLVYPKTYKTFLYELNPEGIIVEGILKKEGASLRVEAEKLTALGG